MERDRSFEDNGRKTIGYRALPKSNNDQNQICTHHGKEGSHTRECLARPGEVQILSIGFHCLFLEQVARTLSPLWLLMTASLIPILASVVGTKRSRMSLLASIPSTIWNPKSLISPRAFHPAPQYLSPVESIGPVGSKPSTICRNKNNSFTGFTINPSPYPSSKLAKIRTF